MGNRIYSTASMLILLLFSQMAQSQETDRIAYYDAKLLAGFYEAAKPEGGISASDIDVQTILEYYYADTDVAAAVLSNPFLKPYFIEGESASTSESDTASAAVLKNKSFDLGGINVTRFANVLSEIMIDHAKQELTIAFFNRFQKFAEEHEEFKVLFPVTTGNLTSLLSYKYTEMLPALRAGFLDDLSKLTYTIDDLLLLPKYKTLLQQFPEVKITIRSLRLLHELESGASNAAEVLKDFAAFEQWDSSGSTALQNMGSSVKLANIFSQSLRSQEAGILWVSPRELKEIVDDKVGFDMYLGLIYARVIKEKIEFTKADATSITFAGFMEQNKENLEMFQNKATEFISLADKVRDSFHENKSSSGITTSEELYNYISVSIDVIDYSFGIARLVDETIEAQNYISIARKSNDLFKAVYSRQYNQAVTYTFDIITEVNNLIANQHPAILDIDNATADENKTIDRLRKGEKLSDTGLEYLTALSNAKNPSDSQKYLAIYRSKRLAKFLEKARPYALFMANMVNAKTDGEMRAALESAILPVGSSYIKKYSKFNFAVQSYLGARMTVGARGSRLNAWNDRVGVGAPIGLAFSKGYKKSGALSLFIPLLDLGAIVDYKLTAEEDASGTSVEKEYVIELGQIFSPGAFIVYGLPLNIPVSVGFGGQYGPGLSSIDATQQIEETNPTWRWSLFLAVDIPLFNIRNIPMDSR